MEIIVALDPKGGALWCPFRYDDDYYPGYCQCLKTDEREMPCSGHESTEDGLKAKAPDQCPLRAGTITVTRAV